MVDVVTIYIIVAAVLIAVFGNSILLAGDTDSKRTLRPRRM